MNPFHQILGNNLVANVTNFTVWFGITFWVYLETGSVFATGMIAGVYLVLTAGLGFWFGSIVDHHRKKVSMLASSGASLAFYALAMAVLQLSPERSFSDPYHPALWGFVLLVMLGVIAGNLRSIAVPCGYSDVPVEELGASHVIAHFDELTVELVERLTR